VGWLTYPGEARAAMRTNGLVLMALAALCFSLMSALAKVAAASLPSSEVVFFRSLLTTVALLGWHHARGGGPLLGTHRGLLLLRGGLGAAALLLYFYALTGLAVADAMLLNQCSPLFVLFLAVPFLGEAIRRGQLLVVPVTVAGVLLVIRPDFQVVNWAGLAGIASAALAGGAYVVVRRLSQVEPAHRIILYFAAISTVAAVPLMGSGFRWPDGPTWAALVGVAAFAVAAQFLLTAAYRVDRAGRVAMAGYLGPVFAGLWDLWLWDRVPPWTTALGALLIVGSLIELGRQRRSGAAAEGG